jgi:LEA14-like dessication related protein
MKRLFWIAIPCLLFCTSCKLFEEPEFVKMGGYQIEGIESSTVHFSVNAVVSNPNWYAIKIKPSHADVYVGDFFMGTVYLEEMLKFKKKIENEVNASFRAELADGALLKAMTFGGQENVNLTLKGKVKAGVFFVFKKIDVNETQSIKATNFGSSQKN